MSNPTPPAKTCTICGEDCSARPRVKDERGRYSCRSCFDRAAAATTAAVKKHPAAPPPLPTDDDALPASFWNDLPEQPAADAPRCPSCTAPLASHAVICLSCGYNLQTGKARKVKVAKAKREGSGDGFKPSMSPKLLGVTIFVVFGAAFFPASQSEAAAVAYYFAYALLAVGTMVSITVSAFLDKRTGWGIAGVLSFVIPCVGLAVLYYALALSSRGHNKVLAAASILLLVPIFAALLMAGVDLEELLR